jgi:hypothetical protein
MEVPKQIASRINKYARFDFDRVRPLKGSCTLPADIYCSPRERERDPRHDIVTLQRHDIAPARGIYG